uniref:AlNc14C25G2512 protein n=1 Tax=Albugo laibachii Nc14 TaxID=890382 RepID=F0W6M4_9STRA|nr:AlNc14C25G2512 [Albugo laibachii Nc14]|eukprot:CCA16769.1 AlNc14C25G2512 [Albugo laibachii Nc14]
MNATRNPRTKNVCYNLGMVDESHRMFRKIFAQVFGIQSLQDLFRDCDTWLKKQAFVNKYYNDEKLNPSDIAEEKLLGRLYEEVTQLLQRIYSTIRLITWIPPSTSVRLFPVGVRIKEKQWVCPSISRSLLSRLV